MKILTFFAIVMLTASTACGVEPSEILGLWNIDVDDSRLELYRCGEKICGNIFWLKAPTYIDSTDWPVGLTKVDRENPDPTLRNRPILGMQVMKDLTPIDGKTWEDGTCYNPKTGKSYKCTMKLVSPGQLKLLGYTGTSPIHNFDLTR